MMLPFTARRSPRRRARRRLKQRRNMFAVDATALPYVAAYACAAQRTPYRDAEAALRASRRRDALHRIKR